MLTNLFGLVLLLSVIENQDRFVDPTIETMHKIKHEMRILNEELMLATENRRAAIKRRLKQLKNQLSCNEVEEEF